MVSSCTDGKRREISWLAELLLLQYDNTDTALNNSLSPLPEQTNISSIHSHTTVPMSVELCLHAPHAHSFDELKASAVKRWSEQACNARWQRHVPEGLGLPRLSSWGWPWHEYAEHWELEAVRKQAKRNTSGGAARTHWHTDRKKKRGTKRLSPEERAASINTITRHSGRAWFHLGWSQLSQSIRVNAWCWGATSHTAASTPVSLRHQSSLIKLWGSDSEDDIGVGLLGCNAVWACG
jgi:hypothetical protein